MPGSRASTASLIRSDDDNNRTNEAEEFSARALDVLDALHRSPRLEERKPPVTKPEPHPSSSASKRVKTSEAPKKDEQEKAIEAQLSLEDQDPDFQGSILFNPWRLMLPESNEKWKAQLREFAALLFEQHYGKTHPLLEGRCVLPKGTYDLQLNEDTALSITLESDLQRIPHKEQFRFLPFSLDLTLVNFEALTTEQQFIQLFCLSKLVEQHCLEQEKVEKKEDRETEILPGTHKLQIKHATLWISSIYTVIEPREGNGTLYSILNTPDGEDSKSSDLFGYYDAEEDDFLSALHYDLHQMNDDERRDVAQLLREEFKKRSTFLAGKPYKLEDGTAVVFAQNVERNHQKLSIVQLEQPKIRRRRRDNSESSNAKRPASGTRP